MICGREQQPRRGKDAAQPPHCRSGSGCLRMTIISEPRDGIVPYAERIVVIVLCRSSTPQGAAAKAPPSTTPAVTCMLRALRLQGGGCATSKPPSGGAPSVTPPAESASPSAVVLQDLDPTPDASRTEAMAALLSLDEQLVGALQQRHLRLLRAAWLREQPAGYILQHRLELEQLEGVTLAPLLSADEAVAALRRGDRSVGVLSQCVGIRSDAPRRAHARAPMTRSTLDRRSGWLMAGHCDPHGVRLGVVRAALARHPHIVAIFWESVPPRPRPARRRQLPPAACRSPPPADRRRLPIAAADRAWLSRVLRRSRAVTHRSTSFRAATNRPSPSRAAWP